MQNPTSWTNETLIRILDGYDTVVTRLVDLPEGGKAVQVETDECDVAATYEIPDGVSPADAEREIDEVLFNHGFDVMASWEEDV